MRRRATLTRTATAGAAAAVALAAVSSLVAGVTPAGQEPNRVRGGYAACLELGDWRAQRAHREAGKESWYELMRRYVRADACRVTDDSVPVEVLPSRHADATRVRRLTVKADTLWWVAREAIEP